MAISPAQKPLKSARVPASAAARRKAAEPFQVEGMITLTPEEAWELYETEARDLLGMSPDEFERQVEELGYLPDERNWVMVSMFQCAKP